METDFNGITAPSKLDDLRVWCVVCIPCVSIIRERCSQAHYGCYGNAYIRPTQIVCLFCTLTRIFFTDLKITVFSHDLTHNVLSQIDIWVSIVDLTVG